MTASDWQEAGGPTRAAAGEPGAGARLRRGARLRAAAQLGFGLHLAAWVGVLALLLTRAGLRVALVVAVAWGIGLALHGLAVFVGPRLWRWLVAREVGRELAASEPRERRILVTEHARSLERLSASVAHEIRNPISAARSLVQQLGEDPASGENVGCARVALEELDRVERSISHLLRFAREEELRVGDVRIADLVDAVLESFGDRIERLGVRVSRELDVGGSLRADAEKLRRVLVSLVTNALDALEASATPEPRLELRAGENPAGTQVWLRVRDNGPGIVEDPPERIFNPFYTSKRNGRGLGLALSKKLVDAHGGCLEVASEPGEGTDFVLTLPRAPARTGF
jgi:signal transduction histidine kinase